MNLLPVAVVVCAVLVYGHATPATSDRCQAKMTAFPLEPGSKCCTHGPNTKTLGGLDIEARIDRDPWAVLIDYELKKGNSKRLCAGTLISGKYVLTAAQCITGPILNIGTPTKVRLGEFDMSHEGPDCVSVEGVGEECTDGAISIKIDMAIPHPKYTISSHDNPSRWNDIGLIRLTEVAPYTDFIRPICLPTTNLETNPPDHSLYAVSWTQFNAKLIYEVPFVNQKKCNTIYSSGKVVLGTGQLCAGGLEGMDPCRGNGGGALVNENKEGLAELTGIVSFGPKHCGLKDFPSVYTNVFEYLDWIKTVIVA